MKVMKSYRTMLSDFLYGDTLFFDPKYDKASMYENMLGQLESMFETSERLNGREPDKEQYYILRADSVKSLLSYSEEQDVAEVERVVSDDGSVRYWVEKDGFLIGALALWETIGNCADAKKVIQMLETRNEDYAFGHFCLELLVTERVDSIQITSPKEATDFVEMTVGEFFGMNPFGKKPKIRLNKEKAFHRVKDDCRVYFEYDGVVIQDNGLFYELQLAKKTANNENKSEDARKSANAVIRRVNNSVIRFSIINPNDY